MAAQPDGGTPVDTGSDGDQEVDLRALQARIDRIERRQRVIVQTLAREADLRTCEMERLLTD